MHTKIVRVYEQLYFWIFNVLLVLALCRLLWYNRQYSDSLLHIVWIEWPRKFVWFFISFSTIELFIVFALLFFRLILLFFFFFFVHSLHCFYWCWFLVLSLSVDSGCCAFCIHLYWIVCWLLPTIVTQLDILLIFYWYNLVLYFA